MLPTSDPLNHLIAAKDGIDVLIETGYPAKSPEFQAELRRAIAQLNALKFDQSPPSAPASNMPGFSRR